MAAIAQRKSLARCFLDGISLANRSFDLLFIMVLLDLVSRISHILPPITFLLTPFWYIVIVAFTLSVPQFLERKQQQVKMRFKAIIHVVMISVKRILIPIAALIVVLICLLFGLVIYLYNILHLRSYQVMHWTQANSFGSGCSGWFFLTVSVLSLVGSLFAFTPMLFSLEQQKLWGSVKGSFAQTATHPRFLGALALWFLTYYLAMGLVPGRPFWGGAIHLLVKNYISLVAISISLNYYQVAIKKRLH